MHFESSLEILHPFETLPAEVIREERSQARVPVAVAREAGPAHRAFIDALPTDWRSDPQVEIFSRLAWLKPGGYPLGPHYHTDWGRPVPPSRVETRMVLLGGASLTEFVDGPFTLTGPPERWPTEVEERVGRGELKTRRLEPGLMVRFDDRVWHRTRPATTTGWRLLLRAIRGLSARPEQTTHPGPFRTLRCTFHPETAEEATRFEPYRT